MPIEIQWPCPAYKKFRPGLIVASGWSDMSIASVGGDCRLSSGEGDPVVCKLILFEVRGGTNAKPQRRRWKFLISLPGSNVPKRYKFTVKGWNAKAAVQEESVEFDVGASGYATIGFPLSGENVTDWKDNLFAYGTLPDSPLVALSLKDSVGNEIGTLHQYSDYQDFHVWSADFLPLASGEYALHVNDANNNPQTATRIKVD